MSHEEREFKDVEFKVTIINSQTEEYRIEFVKAKFDFQAWDLVTLYDNEEIYLCDKYVPYKSLL